MGVRVQKYESMILKKKSHELAKWGLASGQEVTSWRRIYHSSASSTRKAKSLAVGSTSSLALRSGDAGSGLSENNPAKCAK